MSLVRSQVEIVNEEGLHFRAASRFMQLAQRFQADIRVAWENKAANGKSILDLATLAAVRGARLDLEADGPDAEAAILALSELVKAGFLEAEAVA